MKFGENAELYVKVCPYLMCEYGAVVVCWAGNPNVCGFRRGVFLSFERSMLGSCNILSYKRKLPVGGSVNLGTVARRFTHLVHGGPGNSRLAYLTEWQAGLCLVQSCF